MIDQNDKATADLFGKKRRGRPPSKERDDALQQLQDERDAAVISILCKPHSM